METVHLLTLGCSKNTTDSELMLGALVGAGFEITTDPERAQVLVVNTCTSPMPGSRANTSLMLSTA